ncbi:hypothetical protein Naga_100049g25 [Nannochloropsis gaditana]|uniref:Uncharacterized protein n=1 Tax=Nannochloropsis gaditana TaxID=72520 RepID=W7TXF8_9STRA|nr:hypothetical protein Naga_100049g25 [Nannochloropsis gaditana]
MQYMDVCEKSRCRNGSGWSKYAVCEESSGHETAWDHSLWGELGRREEGGVCTEQRKQSIAHLRSRTTIEWMYQERCKRQVIYHKKLGLEGEGGTERARKESTVMEMDLMYGMPWGSMHLGKYAFGGATREILSSGSSCRNSSKPGIYQGFIRRKGRRRSDGAYASWRFCLRFCEVLSQIGMASASGSVRGLVILKCFPAGGWGIPCCIFYL